MPRPPHAFPAFWPHPPPAGETARHGMDGRSAFQVNQAFTTVLVAARTNRNFGYSHDVCDTAPPPTLHSSGDPTIAPPRGGRCESIWDGMLKDVRQEPAAAQHRLYFLPLPHGQGALRPGVGCGCVVTRSMLTTRQARCSRLRWIHSVCDETCRPLDSKIRQTTVARRFSQPVFVELVMVIVLYLCLPIVAASSSTAGICR